MPVPWLLLLDEPSEGIQPSIVQEIGEILAGLRKRDKLSLVVVEQNLDLVLDVADRIVVVERGRIEREVDAHTAQAGGIAELLGMGKMRMTRSAPTRAVAPTPLAASTSAAPMPRAAPTTAAAPRAPSAMPRSSSPPAAPAVLSRGESMSMVKRPTLEQMSKIVASLHMSMSDHEVGDYLEVLEGTMQAYDRVDAAARLPARGALSAHAGHAARRRPRTRSARGTSSRRSRARRTGRSPASASSSRTTSAWPACR